MIAHHCSCADCIKIVKTPTATSTASHSHSNIYVIGAGPSGYFSAIECARQLRRIHDTTSSVTVIESSPIGLGKVLISGGGRCNVMHNPNKHPTVISKGYARGERELLSPLTKSFGPVDTYNWFTQENVQLKVEKDGRCFPTTDKSQTIIDALSNAAIAASVNTRFNTRVTDIQVVDDLDTTTAAASGSASVSNTATASSTIDSDKRVNRFSITFNGNEQVSCDRVIFATGSSKQAHKLIESIGHTIVPAVPSLFSFKMSNETQLVGLAGVSNQDTQIKLMLSKEFVKEHKSIFRPSVLASFTQRGPLLITHQGVSGPCVLRLSAFGARAMSLLQYNFEISVNWLPCVQLNDLISHLLQEKDRYPNRSVGKLFPKIPNDIIVDDDTIDSDTYEFVDGLIQANDPTDFDDTVTSTISSNKGVITKRLWNYVLSRVGISSDVAWSSVSTDGVKSIASELMSSRYAVSGRNIHKDEFVTAGGVQLDQIDFNTMESKKVPGLYFCGECIDIDGITGGYNFQNAWTTGYIAGTNCGNSVSQ